MRGNFTKPGCAQSAKWRRADLALFGTGNAPVALIEAKALYTFEADLTGPYHEFHMPKYEAAINRDLAKASALAHRLDAPDAEIFALLIVTHVSKEVRPELRSLIKYGSYLRKCADRDAADHRIREYLQSLGDSIDITVLERDGEAFELSADVDAWLCGPCVPG